MAAPVMFEVDIYPFVNKKIEMETRGVANGRQIHSEKIRNTIIRIQFTIKQQDIRGN